jgi:putative endonuclease
MYFLYILKSLTSDRSYIGSTQNLEERLKRHNRNAEKATKNRGPWRVIYLEQYSSRSEAVKREKEIKSYKGGEEYRKLLREKSYTLSGSSSDG